MDFDTYKTPVGRQGAKAMAYPQGLNTIAKPLAGIERLSDNIDRLRNAVHEVASLGEALCGAVNEPPAAVGEKVMSNGLFDQLEEQATATGHLADELFQHVKRIRSRM